MNRIFTFWLASCLLLMSCTTDDTAFPTDNEDFNVFTFVYSEEGTVNSAVLGLDIVTGTQDTIASFDPATKLHDFVYNSTTNTLIGVTKKDGYDNAANALYFIDLSDGSFTTVMLDNSTPYMYYSDVVLDATGTIYLFKSDFNQYSGNLHEVVSVNVATGTETVVASYNEGVFLADLTYDEQQEKIFCFLQSFYMQAIDIESGESIEMQLNSDYTYSGLLTNTSNAYFAFKKARYPDSDLSPAIVQLDEFNGGETVLQTLASSITLKGMAYDSYTNAILAIQDDQTLFTFGMETQNTSTLVLSTTPGVVYEEVITK
ncbi:hypothetical protein SAMN05216480_11264 [Pustulibacterium marinum]|uniref:DUF4394 domain-containing protein n=1 Tax=Pustulibacterium marinum TaxID=1224947 RepID=A0A1I7I214_9FLAO|nr:hypothetical protein [Pustulibacterium marinum]SFU66786.1 hypothetical protein SAMN05216480_11264 [Pustulibacterium marinum]